VPSRHIGETGLPEAVIRKVSSAIALPVNRFAPWSQRFCIPLEHGRQTPQAGMKPSTTWSPSLSPTTPGPTFVTTPAPSCPPSTG
jgi:hypothetical protein